MQQYKITAQMTIVNSIIQESLITIITVNYKVHNFQKKY